MIARHVEDDNGPQGYEIRSEFLNGGAPNAL